MDDGSKGIIVGATTLSEGIVKGQVRYYGYAVPDLVQHCSFEEVAHLILYKELPTAVQLKSFQHQIAAFRDLPPALKQVLERIPRATHPTDVLRTACSTLGTLEPELGRRPDAIALRLLSCFGSILLYWHHFASSGQRIACVTSPDDSIALHFLKLLTQRPVHDPLIVKAIDATLTIYAEHEFNMSTFAARVTASTLSDFYSCVIAAIATVRGPLLSGASEAVVRLMSAFKSPADALEKLQEMRKRRQLFPSFHAQPSAVSDSRITLLRGLSRSLASQSFGKGDFQSIAEAMEDYLQREASITPSLDFYTGTVYKHCAVPEDCYAGLYVLARSVGWAAHIFEQRGANKLIRPTALYAGPDPRPVPKL